ncbi:PP12C phosphatase, partial [Eubucco bourcierii]|nr:PP12C phosphatase [Eubucco bourcierii]
SGSSPAPRARSVRFERAAEFRAVCAGAELAEARAMVRAGGGRALLGGANADGISALHQACIDENMEVVQFLVESGADVNQADNEGWTPLHVAASCGHRHIAQYLLEHGADVAAVSSDGELPLEVAEDEALEQLLRGEVERRGVDVAAAKRAEEERMLRDTRRWLDAGEIPDPRHPATGASALHVAAAKGYIEVMRLLLQAGYDPNVRDKDGWTPLHAAAHWGALRILAPPPNHAPDVPQTYVGLALPYPGSASFLATFPLTPSLIGSTPLSPTLIGSTFSAPFVFSLAAFIPVPCPFISSAPPLPGPILSWPHPSVDSTLLAPPTFSGPTSSSTSRPGTVAQLVLAQPISVQSQSQPIRRKGAHHVTRDPVRGVQTSESARGSPSCGSWAAPGISLQLWSPNTCPPLQHKEPPLARVPPTPTRRLCAPSNAAPATLALGCVGMTLTPCSLPSGAPSAKDGSGRAPLAPPSSGDPRPRRCHHPPVRDEESEAQRRARSRLLRQGRRATQGVVLPEVQEAEQMIGCSSEGWALQQRIREEDRQEEEELQNSVGVWWGLGRDLGVSLGLPQPSKPLPLQDHTHLPAPPSSKKGEPQCLYPAVPGGPLHPWVPPPSPLGAPSLTSGYPLPRFPQLYQGLWLENERLREQLQETELKLTQIRLELERVTQRQERIAERPALLELERFERRALERKAAELEEELKALSDLRADNQRLKDENAALIRVISKLSK